MNTATSARHRDDAAGDEGVALEVAAAGEPEREQHRERRERERGAEADPVLPGRERRQERRSVSKYQPCGPMAKPWPSA